jgi:prevent-host-death family protein
MTMSGSLTGLTRSACSHRFRDALGSPRAIFQASSGREARQFHITSPEPEVLVGAGGGGDDLQAGRSTLTPVRSTVRFVAMKTVPITELRQRAADVIEAAGSSEEPTVVLQRSRKAAYIVSPERFERDQEELRVLRHALFAAEVREAEAEYRTGATPEFEDMESLLDELRG